MASAAEERQKKEKLAWGADYNTEGSVLTREDGKPLHPHRVTKVVKRTMVRHGLIKSKLHDLRHFRASALISSGVEIAKVSKIMSHKNISVTNDLYGNRATPIAPTTMCRRRADPASPLPRLDNKTKKPIRAAADDQACGTWQLIYDEIHAHEGQFQELAAGFDERATSTGDVSLSWLRLYDILVWMKVARPRR